MYCQHFSQSNFHFFFFFTFLFLFSFLYNRLYSSSFVTIMKISCHLTFCCMKNFIFKFTHFFILLILIVLALELIKKNIQITFNKSLSFVRLFFLENALLSIYSFFHTNPLFIYRIISCLGKKFMWRRTMDAFFLLKNIIIQYIKIANGEN